MTVHHSVSPAPEATPHDHSEPETWLTAFRRGDEALRRWVLSHPKVEWSSDPGLLVAMAATYRWDGAAGAWTALPYLEAAESLIEDEPGASLRIRAAAALLRSVAERARGDIHAALDHVERTLAILSSAAADIRDRLDLASPALLKRGTIRVLLGDLSGGRIDLERGLLAGDTDLTPRKRVEALGFLAIVEVLGGSFAAADRALHRGRAVSDRMPGGLWTAPLEIAELLLAAERGELALDAPALRRLLTDVEGTEFEFFGEHLRVLLAEQTRDAEALTDAIRRMRVIERGTEGLGLLRILRLGDRVEALLASGDLARASALTEDHDDPDHLLCAVGLRARIALAVGDHEAALALTRRCFAEEDHPIRSLLDVALVDAAAHLALGDQRSADLSFRVVLQEAGASGARRVFRAVSPRLLGKLIERAQGAQDLSTAERAVLSSLAATTGSTPRDDAEDSLTPRERVVLARLAAGDAPRAIAQSLHVSLNTVKTQVRSIYRKLGASSRAGAIERARTLGVLTP